MEDGYGKMAGHNCTLQESQDTTVVVGPRVLKMDN